MVSNKELYNALKTIKQLCDENNHCEDCPLVDNYSQDCLLRWRNVLPAEWELQPPPPPTVYCPIKK